MAGQEPPDFVIGAGAPRSASKPKDRSTSGSLVGAAAMGLLFGPPVASFAVRWFTSSDPWFPIFALWVVGMTQA